MAKKTRQPNRTATRKNQPRPAPTPNFARFVTLQLSPALNPAYASDEAKAHLREALALDELLRGRGWIHALEQFTGWMTWSWPPSDIDTGTYMALFDAIERKETAYKSIEGITSIDFGETLRVTYAGLTGADDDNPVEEHFDDVDALIAALPFIEAHEGVATLDR